MRAEFAFALSCTPPAFVRNYSRIFRQDPVKLPRLRSTLYKTRMTGGPQPCAPGQSCPLPGPAALCGAAPGVGGQQQAGSRVWGAEAQRAQ